ncbi:Endo-1,4-beta-xylanase [Clostridium neonatale]|uniref:endo-1,4-beta-xylanase n=1 Tax=Clostridium neonatale TaxID=137838 RepID=UPI00291BB6BB|nr:endo-1,4-beta-xylanase [Clostridium neonatale]CAI3541296.1 Endo-1,4-beta-xylanase [Clostridium neonatale]
MLNKKKVLKWISVITIGLITNIICIPLQHNIVPALAQTDQIADVQYSENFEESIGEWKTRGGAVVSQDSTQKYKENNSLKVSGRTKTWEGPIKDLTNILTKGETYHFSVYVMYDDENGLDNQVFNLQFESVTGESKTYKAAGSGIAQKGQWTKIEGDYTIPESADKYSLYIELPYKADDKVNDSDKIDFYLDNLVITKTEIAKKDFQRDIPKLKEVFSAYFPVGTEINTNQLDSSDIHSEFLKYQYNALVPGNFMKPDALQPTEGNFNWDEGDKYVEFGQENGMILRGHTLVWHSQIPNWFFEDKNDSTKPASSELLRSRLENHIKTVVGRYKGKIKYWDVVNEVISDNSGLRGENEGSKWKSIIGDIDGDGYDSDYIELAFKYAHEADPEAKLIINEYGTEGSTRKRDDLYNLVERMLKKGIPVDGIGIQSHISITRPSVEQIKSCIEKFATLKKYNPDFTVQVTELDMSIYNSDDEPENITNDILVQQASQYKSLFDVYKEEAQKGNLGLVMFWGNSDDDSWLDNFPVVGRNNASLLFDRNLQAKPAYWAIVNPSKVDVYKKTVNTSSGTPVIGNNVDAKWMTTKSFDVNSFVKGLDGATAKVKSMWDVDNLYIFADVHDETVGDKDSVDIYVSNSEGKYEKYSINRSTNNDRIKVSKTSSGYQIQAKLPLEGIEARLGTKIIFDMKINDNDSNGDITSSAVWNDYASTDTLNPENGGILLFSQASKLVEVKKGTPVIDGSIDDIWKTANVISTDVSLQGEGTAKAKVRLLWDKNYIYVLSEVSDGTLDKTSKNLHEQDSVEAFIDENNARTSDYDNDDAQYRVNYDNEQSGGGNRIVDKFKSAASKTDDGYVVEMAIPLNNQAVVNQILGFDFQVNDATNGTRNGVNIWCDESSMTWSTLKNIGNILLIG